MSRPIHQGVWKKRTHDTHMKQHLPRVKNHQQPLRVMLLGDSHFERLVWFHPKIAQQIPPDVMVASVGGDKVEHVHYRLESRDGLLYNLKQRPQLPEKIIVMAGGNNLNKARDVAPAVAAMVRLLMYVQKECPTIQLEVWAVPRSNRPDHNTWITEYNTQLAQQLPHGITWNDELWQTTQSLKNSQLFLPDGHFHYHGYQKVVIPLLQTAWKCSDRTG